MQTKARSMDHAERLNGEIKTQKSKEKAWQHREPEPNKNPEQNKFRKIQGSNKD